jgi:hypothetical protein
MYRMFQLLPAVLVLVGVISSLVRGYCYNRLQTSPREPQFPFVYELTHRFQARYVDHFHYQVCPVSEVAFAVGLVGPLLIIGFLALLWPERFRAFWLIHGIGGLPLDRMQSIDIRGYGVIVVVLVGLMTTVFVFAQSSN